MKATLMGLASIFFIGVIPNLLSALAGRMARRRRVSISRGCFIFFCRFTLRQTCLRGGRGRGDGRPLVAALNRKQWLWRGLGEGALDGFS